MPGVSAFRGAVSKPEKPYKPNEPLTYYRWYWRDWRASRLVQRMTFIERGLYRELLDEQWKEGSIPADPDRLADICGCPPDVMADAWRTLSKCFADVPGSEGRMVVNERLEAERTEQDTKRAKAAIAGRLGGEAKRTLSERHIAVAVEEQSKAVADEQSGRQANASPDGARSLPSSEPDWRKMLGTDPSGRIARIRPTE